MIKESYARVARFVLLVFALFLPILLVGGCVDLNMVHVQLPKKVIDNYPERPITIVVPFSAGGGTDMTARSLQTLSVKYLGQPLIVINKPGGAGTLGWNEVARTHRDGYTLALTAIDMVLLPHYDPNAKYDYVTALSPVAQISAIPLVLAVKADAPWQTLSDLIADAKQHPGKIKFSHSGTGSISHVLSEMLGTEAGIDIKHVPYDGGSNALATVLGGHVHFLITAPVTIKDHVKGGTIRVLAATGEERMTDPVLAHIPTFKEQGIDITIKNWHGVAVPLDTPYEIRKKLADGFKAMVADPLFIENMGKLGIAVEYLDPEKTARRWVSDDKKLTKALKQNGLLEKIIEQRK